MGPWGSLGTMTESSSSRKLTLTLSETQFQDLDSRAGELGCGHQDVVRMCLDKELRGKGQSSEQKEASTDVKFLLKLREDLDVQLSHRLQFIQGRNFRVGNKESPQRFQYIGRGWNQ